MSIIETTLLKFFQPLTLADITVAYSGGVDSQVLLHALARLKQQGKLKQNLRAIHVNHGLSTNAEQWQNFAKAQCQKLSVELTTITVSIEQQSQQSLEEQARIARYAAIKKHCYGEQLIATGHHIDDQSETFLLALKRGAGVKGLSAMQADISLGQHQLVRPLLTVSRNEIHTYAKLHELAWIEDESNTDIQFDRNFVRHEVMPILKGRWPSIDKTLYRSVQHCQEAQSLLDELAEQDILTCKLEDTVLNTSALLALSQKRFNNAIRFFLAQHQCLMPSTEQLVQVYKQLNVAADKTPAIKVGNHWLRRFREGVYLTPEFQDVAAWQQTITLTDITDNCQIDLPDKLGVLHFSQTILADECKSVVLAAPTEEQQIRIRFCHNNPTCLPDYRQHSRPLKKVLQELNVPTWQRKRIPFVFYNDTLVAALGLFTCKDYIAKDNKKQLSVRWRSNDNSG